MTPENIKKEIEKVIKEEKYLQLPFTTNYQTEAQNIVKLLWKDEKIHFGKLWLNSRVPVVQNEESPIVYILCFNSENVSIMVENFEKFIPMYATRENFTIRTGGESSLMGASIIAIMDSLESIFREVNTLHQKIISTYKSNLDRKIQKDFIKLSIESVDKVLEDNNFLLNFEYPKNIIEECNDLHLCHDWIDKDDSFVISLALDAYRDIVYYQKWIKEHKISEKHFLAKRTKIYKMRETLTEDSGSKLNNLKLPEHPQDILHGLVSFYEDYYQKNISNSSIQDIIKIISDYKRMPKVSKSKKRMQKISAFNEFIIDAMKRYNYTTEEILDYIFESLFDKSEDDIFDSFPDELKEEIVKKYIINYFSEDDKINSLPNEWKEVILDYLSDSNESEEEIVKKYIINYFSEDDKINSLPNEWKEVILDYLSDSNESKK